MYFFSNKYIQINNNTKTKIKVRIGIALRVLVLPPLLNRHLDVKSSLHRFLSFKLAFD